MLRVLSTPGSRNGTLSSLDLEELGSSSRYPKCSLLSTNSFKIFPVYNGPSCTVHSYFPLNVCLCVCSVISNFCNTMDYSPPGSSVRGISRQVYWSGLPFPLPGDLPHQGIKHKSLALAGRFFTTEPSLMPPYE